MGKRVSPITDKAISLRIKKERPWSRDNLDKIKSIGEEWSYGGAYFLLRYGRELREIGEISSYGERESIELEYVLSKRREANALLVGQEGSPLLSLLFHLEKRIKRGKVSTPLLHKKIIVFDGPLFAESAKSKAQFESSLLRLFRDAAESGNIILVIPEFGEFLENGRTLGVEVFELMDSFLASSELQVVALSGGEVFHKILEGNGKIMSRFEKIMVKEDNKEALEDELFLECFIEEKKSGIIFSYGAIEAALYGANRYFGEGEIVDKAKDIIMEAAGRARRNGKPFVGKEDILEEVGEKTGIPTGEASSEEKDKLLNLEEILRKRVVGQDEALLAISAAMRRARSGVSNPDRPIGSFLFLGPTGVGKTETTKALCEAFFGDEKAVLRLDMSEYAGADAPEKLIGSFELGKPGVFSSLVRDKNYGVILLDEFEKTTPEVRNIFLQILDEGFFSDMSGHRVNVRNFIIIATSNAGSDLMWQFMRSDIPIESRKDEIIDDIIKKGIFKPELLNRFDGVIIFHPVGRDVLREIARIKLDNLAGRLRERGIDFVPNERLVDYLVEFGSDPLFGARPMNRAIAEKVEQAIANKLLREEIKQGARVELTAEDLNT